MWITSECLSERILGRQLQNSQNLGGNSKLENGDRKFLRSKGAILYQEDESARPGVMFMGYDCGVSEEAMNEFVRVLQLAT